MKREIRKKFNYAKKYDSYYDNGVSLASDYNWYFEHYDRDQDEAEGAIIEENDGSSASHDSIYFPTVEFANKLLNAILVSLDIDDEYDIDIRAMWGVISDYLAFENPTPTGLREIASEVCPELVENETLFKKISRSLTNDIIKDLKNRTLEKKSKHYELEQSQTFSEVAIYMNTNKLNLKEYACYEIKPLITYDGIVKLFADKISELSIAFNKTSKDKLVDVSNIEPLAINEVEKIFRLPITKRKKAIEVLAKQTIENFMVDAKDVSLEEIKEKILLNAFRDETLKHELNLFTNKLSTNPQDVVYHWIGYKTKPESMYDIDLLVWNLKANEWLDIDIKDIKREYSHSYFNINEKIAHAIYENRDELNLMNSNLYYIKTALREYFKIKTIDIFEIMKRNMVGTHKTLFDEIVFNKETGIVDYLISRGRLIYKDAKWASGYKTSRFKIVENKLNNIVNPCNFDENLLSLCIVDTNAYIFTHNDKNIEITPCESMDDSNDGTCMSIYDIYKEVVNRASDSMSNEDCIVLSEKIVKDMLDGKYDDIETYNGLFIGNIKKIITQNS